MRLVQNQTSPRRPKADGPILELQPRPAGLDCAHARLLVDASLAQVHCADCAEPISAIWALYRFATEQTRWATERKDAQDVIAELERRIRTRCTHCGHVTNISPGS